MMVTEVFLLRCFFRTISFSVNDLLKDNAYFISLLLHKKVYRAYKEHQFSNTKCIAPTYERVKLIGFIYYAWSFVFLGQHNDTFFTQRFCSLSLSLLPNLLYFYRIKIHLENRSLYSTLDSPDVIFVNVLFFPLMNPALSLLPRDRLFIPIIHRSYRK